MENGQLGIKLKKLRKDNNITLQQVADFLDVHKSSVSRWEKGETAKINKSTLAALAVFYNVDIEFLYGSLDDSAVKKESIESYRPKNMVPVLGTIAAGLPLYAEENITGYVGFEKGDGEDYFALRVKGDSMNAARIEEGDLLIIRRQDYIENGEIGAILVNEDEATVKKFYRDGNTVMLIPMSTNTRHQIQVYNLSETKIQILGKVVENKIRF